MRPRTVTVPPEAEPALAFALIQTMDSLEARARIAERGGDSLGRRSAYEYRRDVPQLDAVLRQLGFQPHEPDPEGEALSWFGRPYAIIDGNPARLVPVQPLECLLQDARADGRPGYLRAADLSRLLTRFSRAGGSATTSLNGDDAHTDPAPP